MKKRIVCFILCVVTVLSCFAIPAFACNDKRCYGYKCKTSSKTSCKTDCKTDCKKDCKTVNTVGCKIVMNLLWYWCCPEEKEYCNPFDKDDKCPCDDKKDIDEKDVDEKDKEVSPSDEDKKPCVIEGYNYVNPYIDVFNSDWYFKPIMWCYENGAFTGTTPTTYSPCKTLTRAMIVRVLAEISDENYSQYAYENIFTDVPENAYYTKAVIWAVKNGVAKGVSETEFAPNAKVTREQFVTFLYAFAKYKGYDVTDLADISSYTDADQISSWALIPMKWAVANGLITGSTNYNLPCGGTYQLNPKVYTKRSEAAVIIRNFCVVFVSKYEKSAFGQVSVVNFNANGGECDIVRKVVSYGSALGNLPIPEREGYCFGGWFYGKQEYCSCGHGFQSFFGHGFKCRCSCFIHMDLTSKLDKADSLDVALDTSYTLTAYWIKK